MKELSLLAAGCAVLLFGAAVHSQAPPSRQRGEQGPGPVTFSGRSPSAAAVKRFKIDAHYHFRDSPDFVKQTVDVHRKYNTMVVALTQHDAIEHTKEVPEDIAEQCWSTTIAKMLGVTPGDGDPVVAVDGWPSGPESLFILGSFSLTTMRPCRVAPRGNEDEGAPR